MAVDDALDLFGISKEDLSNKDLIKKKYRQLSLKYHPDRGGSDELMKRVNDAKATLDKAKSISVRSSSGGFDWDELNKKYQELGKRIKKILQDGFQPEKYVAYFSKIYNENFKYDITKTFPKENNKRPSYAGFECEFYNKDRTIVFELYISSMLVDATSTTSLGGTDKYISFPLMVIAYGLYKNRKLKVAQRDWKSTNDHKVLHDPTLAFPEKKLEQFKQKAKHRKFTRKDMLTYLTKKLKGTYDGQWVKIPLTDPTPGKIIGDNLKLYLERNVFMRQAGWQPMLFKGVKAVPGGIYVTFPETEETAEYFDNLVSKAQRIKGEDKIIKYVHNELQKYKDEKRNK